MPLTEEERKARRARHDSNVETRVTGMRVELDNINAKIAKGGLKPRQVGRLEERRSLLLDKLGIRSRRGRSR